MPSQRKRIGYLPSINAQETITKISKKENLSQSKVVGRLVEEALLARGEFDPKNSYNLIGKNLYGKETKIDNAPFNYNDLEELISDKGITYNRKKYDYNLELDFSQNREVFNEELFEQFKQFILFQKMAQNN